MYKLNSMTMKEFKTINDILDFAINSEQQAADFYYELASKSKSTGIKETFIQYAKEENGHKARLIKIKQEGITDIENTKVLDLKIGDYLVSVNTSDDMTYQDSLILAMKREKVAYKLYMKLSDITPDKDLKKVFINLANDEAKHKLKFEIEYDDNIYKEN